MEQVKGFCGSRSLRDAAAVYKVAAELATYGEGILALPDDDAALADLGLDVIALAGAYVKEFLGDLAWRDSLTGQKELSAPLV